ncbi:zinc finger protein 787-like isoform X2 [Melanaphis sacchari]|uniref:zinc finger protein 787-like isoform X2 n=1 Tax=Melanaphis sacchari TaxID=742174 RepID=UPI000DC13A59|nr:zinc finger protein 787-like isoform X2 [Melanaphis sacchari]
MNVYFIGKKYSCLRCENKYKYKRELIQHQSNMCGVPPKFYCTMKIMYNGEFGYKCHNQSCGRIYKTKPGIHNHLKYECGVSPKFYCKFCKRFFKQPVSYKAHMLNIHKQLINFK